MGNSVGYYANSYINTEGSARSNGFAWHSTAQEVARDISLTGKNIIVTGANAGVGKECAKQFAKMGAHVIMGCRSMDKAEAAANEIRAEVPTGDIVVMKLDIGSLKSVREFAEKFNNLKIPLHILLNNAGVMNTPVDSKTDDGHEMQFGTNHLGHFLLTNLLWPSLKAAAPNARVVNVASAGHRMQGMHFDDLSGSTWAQGTGGTAKLYGQSKTANILFAKELNRKMQAESIGLSTSLHPGGIRTELQRHAGGFLWDIPTYIGLYKTIPQGAATSVYCCTAPEVAEKNQGGDYFSDSNVAIPAAYATSVDDAKKLWEVSEKLVGLV